MAQVRVSIMSNQFLALYDIGTYDEVYYDTLVVNIILGLDVEYEYEYIYGKIVPELIIKQYNDIPSINIDKTYIRHSINKDVININKDYDDLIIKPINDFLRIKMM